MRFLLLALLAAGGDGFGESSSTRLSHLHLGSCQLPDDPLTAPPWPAVCLQGNLAQQAVLLDGGQDNAHFSAASYYAGLHLSRWVSLHSRGTYERLEYMFSRHHEPTFIAENKRRIHGFVQFGNAKLTQFTVAAGRFKLPFGFNHEPHPEYLRASVKSQRYWDSPDYAVRASLENETDVRLDLGIATESDPRHGTKKPRDGAGSARKEAVTARLLVDISALGGTRFSISYYEDRSSEKRQGAGIFNRNRAGAETAFEWVRIRSNLLDRMGRFDQLLRLSYLGNFQSGGRWNFEYEDDFKRHWLTTLGHDIRVGDYNLARIAFSYHKPRGIPVSPHWKYIVGWDVSL